MKFIITVFYLIFLSNIALAETSSDYMGKKQSDMDENYECSGHIKNKINYISYKKVNGKLFKYNYWPDMEGIDGTMGATGDPDSVVKKFELDFNNSKFVLYMDFTPVMEKSNLENGVIIKILIKSKLKQFGIQQWAYWVKNNSANEPYEMLKEWIKIKQSEPEESFDRALAKWSEKAYNIISKELDFGKPFELVDLETINKDGLHKTKGGNYATIVKKCKQL